MLLRPQYDDLGVVAERARVTARMRTEGESCRFVSSVLTSLPRGHMVCGLMFRGILKAKDQYRNM